jgi:hypothetical protein
MSFVRLGSTPRYICASTDSKLTAGIETGATVYETDTKKYYIFNGIAWTEKPKEVNLDNFDIALSVLLAGIAGSGVGAKTLADIVSALGGTLTTQLTGSIALKGAVGTVATAGTREQIAAYACREVTIIALDTNTGYVYIGGSDVSSTVYGVKLAAKDSITLAISNTNLIYIDSSVNGEGISYVAV